MRNKNKVNLTMNNEEKTTVLRCNKFTIDENKVPVFIDTGEKANNYLVIYCSFYFIIINTFMIMIKF